MISTSQGWGERTLLEMVRSNTRQEQSIMLTSLDKERGRLHLMTHLVTLQQTLITLLQQSTGTTAAVILPDLATLLRISNKTRTNAVAVLKQQYQRMCQKVLVQASLSPAHRKRCYGRLEFSYSWCDACYLYNCSKCRARWHVPGQMLSNNNFGDFRLQLRDLLLGHGEDLGSVYCHVCKEWIGETPNDWTSHLYTHSSSMIRAAWKSANSCVVM